jgi:hypothetical protein
MKQHNYAYKKKRDAQKSKEQRHLLNKHTGHLHKMVLVGSAMRSMVIMSMVAGLNDHVPYSTQKIRSNEQHRQPCARPVHVCMVPPESVAHTVQGG